MYIKYKGSAGPLLRDISLEYKMPVNLQKSEVILKHFFKNILNTLNDDKCIEFICNLPAFLKPFCSFAAKDVGIKPTIDMEANVTILPIMKLLEKYVEPKTIARFYASLPAHLFSNIYKIPDKINIG